MNDKSEEQDYWKVLCERALQTGKPVSLHPGKLLRLLDQIDRLRAALQPFAAKAAEVESLEAGRLDLAGKPLRYDDCWRVGTLGDCRKAKEVLG